MTISGLSGLSGKLRIGGSSPIRTKEGDINTASSSLDSATLSNRSQAYDKAYDKFNQVGDILNFSKDTLKSLSNLTGDLINLATRAASSTASETKRKELNTEFQKIGNKFESLIESGELSSTSDINILSKDGLTEVFKSVGLNEENSQELASVFEKFKLSSDDKLLASTNTQGSTVKRTYVEQYPGVGNYYSIEQISQSDGGSINSIYGASSGQTIYGDDEQEGGSNVNEVNNLFFVSTDGSLTSFNDNLSEPVSLLSMSQNGEYGVITSTGNFLGTNAGNYLQAYVIDSTGSVISQLTDFSANYTIAAGDVSDNGTIAALSITGNHDGLNADAGAEVYIFENQTLVDPASMTRITSLDPGDSLSEIQVSGSGKFLAYKDRNDAVNIYGITGGITDNYYRNDVVTSFDFSAEDDLLTLIGNQTRVYEIGTGSDTSTYEFQTVPDTLTFLTDGQTAFAINGDGIYNGLEEEIISLESTDIIYSVTAVTNSIGGTDYIFTGTLTGRDSEAELYRATQKYDYVKASSSDAGSGGGVFDNSISDSTNALRTLNDLSSLKKQIDSNIKTIDDAIDLVGKNLQAIQIAKDTTLNLASSGNNGLRIDQLTKEISKRIKKEIGSDPNNALVNNLDPISVASLLSDESDSDINYFLNKIGA